MFFPHFEAWHTHLFQVMHSFTVDFHSGFSYLRLIRELFRLQVPWDGGQSYWHMKTSFQNWERNIVILSQPDFGDEFNLSSFFALGKAGRPPPLHFLYTKTRRFFGDWRPKSPNQKVVLGRTLTRTTCWRRLGPLGIHSLAGLLVDDTFTLMTGCFS